MDNPMIYYGWLKLAPSAPLPSPAPPALPAPPGRILQLGHRPPAVVAAATPHPAGVTQLSTRSKPTVLSARPSDYGLVWVDQNHNGIPGSRKAFEVVHFIGDHAQAVAWIDSEDGKAWRANAESYCLIGVATPPFFDEKAAC